MAWCQIYGSSFDHGLLAFERERLEEVILKDPGVIEKYVDVAARQAYYRYVSSSSKGGCAGDLESRILGSVAATYGSETRKF